MFVAFLYTVIFLFYTDTFLGFSYTMLHVYLNLSYLKTGYTLDHVNIVCCGLGNIPSTSQSHDLPRDCNLLATAAANLLSPPRSVVNSLYRGPLKHINKAHEMSSLQVGRSFKCED